jgi:DNA-directed RNA polymerase subunit E'/Rpb7
MFFVHEMEERIPLHPSYFSSEAPDSIRELLYKKKEGTNTGTMMIVRIIGILEISEPKVMPGTGMAMYTISYRAVVWQPFRGEVVDGEVSQVVNNGFFVDVGALSVFVSKAVSLRREDLHDNTFADTEADWLGTDDSQPAEVLDGRRDAFFRRQRRSDRRSRLASAIAHQGYPLRVEPDVCHWQHPRGLSWVRSHTP